MALTTQQYRPLSNTTTGIDGPLCVRDIVDAAANLNNMKRYALAPKLLSHLSGSQVRSGDTTTDELVVMPPFAPRFISGGYTSLRWYIHAARLGGAGTITWKLYASAGLYRGPYVFDVTYMRSGYKYGSIGVASNDPAIYTTTIDLTSTRPCVDKEGLIWFLLTATNDTADATYGEIKTCDVFARLA